MFQLANQEAQRLNHEYLGTEHLLLGLVKEGSGVAAAALDARGMMVPNVHAEVTKLVAPGSCMATMGKLPQTPQARRAVEAAMKEAQALQHDYVGTEHILLGLLHEADVHVAGQVMKSLGVDASTMRRTIMDMLCIPSVEKMTFNLVQQVRTPGHVFATLFANGASCGTLTMTPEEFGRFAELIENGALQSLLNVDVAVVTAKEAEEHS